MQTPSYGSKGCSDADQNLEISFWKVREKINIYILPLDVLPTAHLRTAACD